MATNQAEMPCEVSVVKGRPAEMGIGLETVDNRGLVDDPVEGYKEGYKEGVRGSLSVTYHDEDSSRLAKRCVPRMESPWASDTY